MDVNEYLKTIKMKLTANYDIFENFKLNNSIYPMYCKYFERSERYIGLKSAKIYAIENKEHIFFKEINILNLENLNIFISELKTHINEIVNPNHEHMSSTLTGVILFKNIPNNETINAIQKFKYQKSFKFGLNGWAEIRILAININEDLIYHSKKSKDIKDYYTPKKLIS